MEARAPGPLLLGHHKPAVSGTNSEARSTDQESTIKSYTEAVRRANSRDRAPKRRTDKRVRRSDDRSSASGFEVAQKIPANDAGRSEEGTVGAGQEGRDEGTHKEDQGYIWQVF